MKLKAKEDQNDSKFKRKRKEAKKKKLSAQRILWQARLIRSMKDASKSNARFWRTFVLRESRVVDLVTMFLLLRSSFTLLLEPIGTPWLQLWTLANWKIARRDMPVTLRMHDHPIEKERKEGCSSWNDGGRMFMMLLD